MTYFFFVNVRAARIAAIGASNLRLQLDLYHRHRMEGHAAEAHVLADGQPDQVPRAVVVLHRVDVVADVA